MASKLVTDRQKLSLAVRQAAHSHASEVGALLEEVFAPVLGAEALPDVTRLQFFAARLVALREELMIEADETHIDELVGDHAPRRRRDELAEEVHTKLVSIRETVTGLFGAVFARDVLGFDGPTSRDPVVLHRQAARVLRRLSEAQAELPPLRVGGVQLDPAELVAQLQPAVDELRQWLEAVARERRDAESTQSAKNRALAQYDEALGGSARLLIGLFELAGRRDYAERIRLTLPRTGRGPGEPEPEPLPPEVEEAGAAPQPAEAPQEPPSGGAAELTP